MPKKGIHPIVRDMVVVMRNGATFRVKTTQKYSTPYFLSKDTTNHPAWTGEEASYLDDGEDGQTSKFLQKFKGFDMTAGPPKVERKK